MLYGESLKHHNGNGTAHQFAMHGSLMNGGNNAPSHGTMSSIRSGLEHRMSLNINPLNELESSYGNNEVCFSYMNFMSKNVINSALI